MARNNRVVVHNEDGTINSYTKADMEEAIENHGLHWFKGRKLFRLTPDGLIEVKPKFSFVLVEVAPKEVQHHSV